MTPATLTQTQEEHARILAEYFGDGLASVGAPPPDIVSWAESAFLIPETSAPIKLQPVQKVFLRYGLENREHSFTTLVYSTIKKSGKTAVSGLVGRYLAEFSGPKGEIYFLANDKEQAKDRAHEAAKTSIELQPGFDRGKRSLPGLWKIIEKQAVHEPTGSIMRAIASDYEGAAGGNPTATFWTELWGFNSERFKRLWDEMTPVPTRKRSIRYVESYAGFTDESEILWDLYTLAVTHGRRLTREELTPYGGWPYADEPPFYVNLEARTFAYWDDGDAARRMPWQIGPEADAYYAEQEATLRPEAYLRLHKNFWVSSVQQFIPDAWYVSCHVSNLQIPAPGPGHAGILNAGLQPYTTAVSPGFFKSYTRNAPVVMSIDASISGDCTALVGVSRSLYTPDTNIRTRFCHVFKPPHNGTIDYAEVEETVRRLTKDYNIVQIPYDVYQLHSMMQKLTREAVAWCKQFSQAGDREVADKALYDLIKDRRLEHDYEIALEYITNCAAYVALSASKTAKLDRLRLVKKAKTKPIDPVVALSMACYECLRLNL